MPSALPSRHSLPSQTWKGSRYGSTGQELKTAQSDERIAAILHGKRRDGGEKEVSKRSPAERPAPASSLRSHHGVQKSAESKRPSNRPNNQAQFEKSGVGNRKRKANTHLNQRSARRQRHNPPELRDEAYIRSTMTIPTPQDYPDAPTDVFKNPKGSILNIAHGQQLAECRSEYTILAAGAYQCTVYYNSAMHNEAVVGEGRTQASRSIKLNMGC